MTVTDGAGRAVGPQRSRPAVIGLGVGAMLIAFVMIPVFPFVVVAVMIWWLADDLRREPPHRLGWLGAVALGVFAVLAVATALIVTLFDAHFDCGGTLGGLGEAADARLDSECRDDRLWRSVVAGVVALSICAAGAVAVYRSGPTRSPLAVSAGAIGAMLGAIVAVVAVLVWI